MGGTVLLVGATDDIVVVSSVVVDMGAIVVVYVATLGGKNDVGNDTHAVVWGSLVAGIVLLLVVMVVMGDAVADTIEGIGAALIIGVMVTSGA